MTDKALEQRRSRLARMAGNIAAGLITSQHAVDYTHIWPESHRVRQMAYLADVAVEIAVEIDRSLDRKLSPVVGEATPVGGEADMANDAEIQS